MAISQHTVMTSIPENLLIVLCVHGSKHAWEQLKWICDIAELVRTHPDLQWEHMLASASDLRCRRMVLLGLSLARQWYEVDLPAPVLCMIASDPDLPD